jgi:hypothetical protein
MINLVVGDRQPTFDHVVPKRLRVYGHRALKVIVCRRCNRDKKDYTLREWLWRLTHGGDPRAVHVLAIANEVGELMIPPVSEIERVALIFYTVGRKNTMQAWYSAVKRAKAGEQPSDFENYYYLEILRENAVRDMKK